MRWTPYRIPLWEPLHTSRAVISERYGLILELESEGVVGIGEAAPPLWTGASTIKGYCDLLEADGQSLVDRAHMSGTEPFEAILVRHPALRAGLQTALLDLSSRRQGQTIAALLHPAPAARVRVNCLIADATIDAAVRRAGGYREAGFEDFKLKVGMNSNRAEVARIAAVREAIGPGATLRLDANGAWTPVEAIKLLRSVESLNVELVEQPVTKADIAGLRKVRDEAPVAVAADEAIESAEGLQRVLKSAAADFLVLKIAVLGGIDKAQQASELARTGGVACLVTGSIESGVGLAAGVQLAAALQPQLASGLATLDLLESPLIEEDLSPVRGFVTLPATPGSGVTLDRGELGKRALGQPGRLRLRASP